MSIGFPTGVSQGTTHTIGQVTWEWNGYAWEVVVSTIAGLTGAPGATGNTGPTGVGISDASLSNYELIITYTNGVTQNIGYIRGDTGATGAPGTAGTAGTNGINGNTGSTGNGVTGFNVSGNNLYYWYMNANGNTFGSLQNAGYVRGPTGNTGSTGASITNVRQENGELLVEIDGGQEINVGFLPVGPTGPTGPAGSGGGAAGTKTYAIFTPLDNEPPSANFATIDTVNSISVLDFDGTTQESAIFRSMIPEGASFSNLLATLYFTASTVTGGVVWGVQYEKLTGGGITGDRFTGGVTGLATLSGATSTPVGITLLSSSYDGLTVGDPYRVKVYRDAAHPADGMGGDAELLIVEIRGA